MPTESPYIFRFTDIRDFKRCRRKWLNSWYYGLTTPEFAGDRKPTKADTGTLVHAGMESFYNGGPLMFSQEKPVSESWQKDWDDTFLLAQIMLEGYGDWLADEGVDQDEETVGTEMELDWQITDDVILRVHLDRLVLDKTWDRYIVEDTKTVDSLSKGLTFNIEEQLLTYALVVQNVLGYDVAACRHNMLRRVKRTARATPPFYGREEMTPSETQLANHHTHLLATTDDMVQCIQHLDQGRSEHRVAYPNPTRDCSWDCKFLPICAMHDDGSDLTNVRQTLYIKREDQHD